MKWLTDGSAPTDRPLLVEMLNRNNIDALQRIKSNVVILITICILNVIEQAKPETVKKVCDIVRKQLALPDDSKVDGESKFAALGADSLDTVFCNYLL